MWHKAQSYSNYLVVFPKVIPLFLCLPNLAIIFCAFDEQLALQRANKGSSGFTTESYVLEIIKMKRLKRTTSPNVYDTTRKHFHGDY